MAQGAAHAASNRFWDFSLAVYARPGVPEACLSLQDDCGADVNILMFCAWTGVVRRSALGHDDCARIVQESADWRETIVHPLREVRRAVKARLDQVPADTDPYGALKAAELAAEKTLQVMLSASFAGLGRPSPRADAKELAAGNMMTYMAVLDKGGDPDEPVLLSVISGAAVEASAA